MITCEMKALFVFQKDVEATVNLRYVTSGSLKTSRHNFDPESGQISLSLRVPDEGWQPRTGLDKWSSTSRTFVEVSSRISEEAKKLSIYFI